MNENTAEPACPPRGESPAEMSRRKFLERISIGLGALCAAILGVPVIGFLLAPLFRKTPEVWRTVGKVGEYEIGKTVNVAFLDASPLPWAGVTAKTAAWLRRVNETEFIAFAVNCTHLGCPVRWLAGAELFMCPCHGGVYYKDGSVAAGPPPKPLTRYQVRVFNGEVQIQSAPVPITS